MLMLTEGRLLYGEPYSKKGRSGEDLDDLESTLVSGVLPSIRSPLTIPHGEVLSEASLFVNWINRGRLLADSLSYLFALEASEFLQSALRHPDAYAGIALYAKSFVAELNAEVLPSDIPNFEIVARRRYRKRVHTLHVRISGATGLRNADGFFMGTSDPYCVCRVRGMRTHTSSTRRKTETVSNCTDPIWNEDFVLNFSGNHELEFQVYDSDMFPKQDELLGFAHLPCSEYSKPGGFEGELKLQGNKATGSLRIRVSDVPFEEV